MFVQTQKKKLTSLHKKLTSLPLKNSVTHFSSTNRRGKIQVLFHSLPSQLSWQLTQALFPVLNFVCPLGCNFCIHMKQRHFMDLIDDPYKADVISPMSHELRTSSSNKTLSIDHSGTRANYIGDGHFGHAAVSEPSSEVQLQ